MKTIEAFENDIFLQIPYLNSITLQKPLSGNNQKNAIFCGSGDSLAASLLVEAFSNFKIRAADPLDLLKNPSIMINKDVYLISVSGNTISNVKVSKISKNSIAITSNSKSKLARKCKKNIILDFPNSGVFTSGSIGFLSSVMIGLSLVCKFKIENYFELFQRAVIESKKIKLGKKIYIIGNLHSFPIAMYAAAKFYEILGLDAHYERIEQFLHMGIFSAVPGDTVIVLEEKNSHNSRMIKNLNKLGLNVFQPNPGTKNKISQVIFFTFFSQLVPLFYAQKNHQRECYFVTSKNLRKVSSNMIY